MTANRPHALSAIAAAVALAFTCQSAAHAEEARATASDARNVFTLGQITVSAQGEDETPLGTDTLDNEQLWDFNKDGLADALNLVPGVATTSGAGNRNEAVISVRGFDRWQVPLLLDGIRLYLPADNRIDFDRFLTPDLAEIQVSKGYVSVLNGPDGMGGAINLVTRKPVKAFEAELRASANFADNGHYNGNTAYANIGTRQEQYYAQISVEQRDARSWYLSDDYKATAAQGKGKREHTSKKDWRANLKVALTPNTTDEYSLNFVKQSGEKHGVGAVTGNSAISTWDWPKWDTWSVYWLSHTQLSADTYLKTRAYYNKFDNDLVAYTNVSLDTQNWTSVYDDNAKGVSVELGTEHFANHTLKTALHWRRDNHTEWQITHRSGFVEPKQSAVEDVMSVAIEDTWHLTPKFDLVAGISRDVRRSKKAEEFANDALFRQPVSDSWATNYQAAGIYRYSDSGKVHLSASNRTRFPTMFERFSSRFGGALSNPWLDPERALNIELGLSERIAPGVQANVALFHNKVKDAIQSVNIDYQGAVYSQSQNVGEATFKGVEVGLDAAVSHALTVGGHYTYIDTQIDNPNDDTARLTTAPRHKAFAYAKWTPLPQLDVIPNIEYADARWSSRSGATGYVRTGEYALVGLKLEYKLSPTWNVALTGRNLLDKNYAVVDGYPQEGRNFILSTRLQF